MDDAEIATVFAIITLAPGNPPAMLHAQQFRDAHAHWIIPGFISAHSHRWQVGFRGLAADSTLTGWLTAVYSFDYGGKSVCSPVPADIDHTCNGYTFRAEMDSGIRFIHGYSVLVGAFSVSAAWIALATT